MRVSFLLTDRKFLLNVFFLVEVDHHGMVGVGAVGDMFDNL